MGSEEGQQTATIKDKTTNEENNKSLVKTQLYCSNHDHQNIERLAYICKFDGCENPFICNICFTGNYQNHYDEHRQYFTNVEYQTTQGLIYYYEVLHKKLKEQILKKRIAEKLQEDFVHNYNNDKKVIEESFDKLKHKILKVIENEFDYHKNYFLEKLDSLNNVNRSFIEKKDRESNEGFTFYEEKINSIKYLFQNIEQYLSVYQIAGRYDNIQNLFPKTNTEKEPEKKFDQSCRNEVDDTSNKFFYIKYKMTKGGSSDVNTDDNLAKKHETNNGFGVHSRCNYTQQQIEDYLYKLKDVDTYMNLFCKQNQNTDEDFWKHANKGFYAGFFECVERDQEPRVQSQVHDQLERLNKSCYFIDGFAWQSSYMLDDKGPIQRLGSISARSINSFYQESKKLIGQKQLQNRLDLQLDTCFNANSASQKFFTTICKALPITVKINSFKLSARKNGISEDSCRDISYAIKQFREIDMQQQDLSQNDLNSNCVLIQSEAMKYFQNIKVLALDISNNLNYERALSSLIRSLQKIKTLKSLVLNIDCKNMKSLENIGELFVDKGLKQLERLHQKLNTDDEFEDSQIRVKVGDQLKVDEFKNKSDSIRNIIIRTAYKEFIFV